MEAFALEVYRRFLNGQTVEQLSTDLGIPMDRIDRHGEILHSIESVSTGNFPRQTQPNWSSCPSKVVAGSRNNDARISAQASVSWR
jgi:hypothetical protein